MKAKQLVVLLSILGLLILLAIWQKREIIFKSRPQTEQSALLFPDFKPRQASRIQLTSPDRETVLVKQDDRWLVATASNIPAATEYIAQLLDQTGQIKKGDLVSRQPEKFGIFEVDKSGLTVKITDEGEKLIAHFYLGKQGPDFNSRYFRKEGSNDVFLINRSLRTTFDREDWREKRVFDFDAQAALKLNLEYDKQQFSLIKDETGWRLTQPEATAQQKVVAALLDNIGRLWRLDYLSAPEPAQYGLDKPWFKLRLGLADGNSYALLVGNKNTDGSAYYAKREAEAYIFTLPTHQVDGLKKKLADLKEKGEGTAQGASPAPQEEKGKSAKE